MHVDKILLLPSSFSKMLEKYRKLFTRRSFPYFCSFIQGILLSSNKHVTGFYMFGILRNYFNGHHRFLNRNSWDIDRLCLHLLDHFIALFHFKEILFALDDTLVGKYGKHIFGRGTHYNHSSTSSSRYLQGHNWVVMSVVHYSNRFFKWFSLPFLGKLFIPKKSQLPNRCHVTRITIASQMIETVSSYFSSIKKTIVTDAFYATSLFLKTCHTHNVCVVSRLKKDSAIYKPYVAKKNQKKKRGRPRIKGKRFASLSDLIQQKKFFNILTLPLYGEDKTIEYREILAYWPVAKQVIKIVLVWYPQKKKKVPAFFFSTDTNMSADKILTIVAARWSIENCFKDLKELLGITLWQCRKEIAVKRSIPLTCIAYSLLHIWSMTNSLKNKPVLAKCNPWYRHKMTISTYDMIKNLKEQTVHQAILQILKNKRKTTFNSKQISAILKIAA